MKHRMDGANGSQRESQNRPRVTTYNRLVRDRITDIIESNGNIAIWQTLNDDDFRRALLNSLAFASHQFASNESLESLADVLESIDAWLELQGLSMEEVERARDERKKRCGTFAERRFLEMVADGNEADRLPLRDWHC